MKVIDLLNKIANGEIPEHIRYNDMYMTYDKKKQNYYDSFGAEIDWKYTIMQYINDEVEIIEDTPKEDKKIEKLDRGEIIHKNAGDWGAIYRTKEWTDNELEILDKMDEIIDELEKLKSKPTIVNINNTPTMHEPYKITYSTNTNGSDK